MSAKRPVLCGIALLAVTFAAYWPALSLGFVDYDDNIYVFKNDHVAAGLTGESVVYAWTTFDSGNWIPITWMSYLLDATLFKIQPAAFHTVNVVIHALNVLLLFVWLWRLTRAQGRSFAVASLFAVHPLHVESVAWVAERKDLLSLFFLLLTLIGYEFYRQNRSPARYALLASTLGLGLLSKSMLVTAPLLLWLVDFLAWDRLPIGGEASSPTSDSTLPYSPMTEQRFRQVIGEKLPLLVMSCVIGLVTISAQGTALTSFRRIPIEYRAGNSAIAYGWYLWKTFVPTDLGAVYSHPMLSVNWGWAIMSVAAFIGLAVYSKRSIRQTPHLPFGGLWFVITLLPVIGLMQVGTQAYADRYSYIPQIGLAVAIVWEVEWLLRRISAGARVAAFITSVAVLVFTIGTIRQISYWKDTETLFRHAVACSADNWEAHHQLGNLLAKTKNLDEAYDHLTKAITVNPNGPQFPDVLYNLAWIDSSRQNWDGAIQGCQKTLDLYPGREDAMQQLMRLLKQQKRGAQALPYLERYLDRHPQDAGMANELGLIYARRGDLESARRQFTVAAKIEPENLSIRTNLGLALSQLGRAAEARPHLEAVVAGHPDDANAHVNLGMLLESLHLQREAKNQFEIALQLNPQDSEAQTHLNNLKSGSAK